MSRLYSTALPQCRKKRGRLFCIIILTYTYVSMYHIFHIFRTHSHTPGEYQHVLSHQSNTLHSLTLSNFASLFLLTCLFISIIVYCTATVLQDYSKIDWLASHNTMDGLKTQIATRKYILLVFEATEHFNLVSFGQSFSGFLLFSLPSNPLLNLVMVFLQ